MIRDEIKAAQTAAMKGGDKERLAAVRLILAKIKDRDIELRTARQVPEDDALVTDVLQKMVKQRRESIAMYEQGGRAELAAKQQAELDVIEGFLPTQMSADETREAIEAIKTEVGASHINDMGKETAGGEERTGRRNDLRKTRGPGRGGCGEHNTQPHE